MMSLLTSSFKIALGSLKVNKARSFLTILGVVIGIASVIILVSVGSGLKLLISQQFLNLGSNLLIVLPGEVSLSKGPNFQQQFSAASNSKLDETDLKIIKRISGVSAALPSLNNFLSTSFNGKSLIAEVNGTGEDMLKILNWSIPEGRFFTSSEMETGKKVVVIGSKVREELLRRDPLGKNLQIGHDRFRVIGILTPKGGTGQHDWDTHIFMPLGAAKRLFGNEKLRLIYFQAEDEKKLRELLPRVKEALLRRHKSDEFSIVEQTDLLNTISTIINSLTLALGGIAAISLIVGGIGIMNIMLVTVTERTREIGLRKALGARKTDILWQFLLEAVVLSSLGGVVGIGLGYSGSFALGKFLTTSVTLWSVVLAFFFSALVGIIFGILPAYKASKLDPIAALRYE